MWEKRKKEEAAGALVEAERERLSARAYALEDAFCGHFSRSAWKARRQMRMRFFWKRRLRITIFGKIWGEWTGKNACPFF